WRRRRRMRWRICRARGTEMERIACRQAPTVPPFPVEEVPGGNPASVADLSETEFLELAGQGVAAPAEAAGGFLLVAGGVFEGGSQEHAFEGGTEVVEQVAHAHGETLFDDPCQR